MSGSKFLLELFSGTGSVGAPWREAGHRVISVDISGRYNPDVCENILLWDYKSLDRAPDVIWASVPCEQYSCARTRAKTPRNFELADALVARTIEIIRFFQVRNNELCWFVENPDTSLLWSRAVAWDLYPRVRLDYCQYPPGPGYRKRTRISTNVHHWTPRGLCDPSSCPYCVDGRHILSAQRGPVRGKGPGDVCSLDTLHALPRALTEEIMAVCAA
jgi:hypothetical protein